jgi:hypothetical protein
MHWRSVNATTHYSLVHTGLHKALSDRRITEQLGFNPHLGKRFPFRCSVQTGYFPMRTGDLSRDLTNEAEGNYSFASWSQS